VTADRAPALELDDLFAGDGAAFALIHRPESLAGPGLVDVMSGEMTLLHRLGDIPLGKQDARDGPRHEALAIIPYRQITERGFACRDDGEPVLAMTVQRQSLIPVAEVIARITDVPVVPPGITVAPRDRAAAWAR
jgi:2-amino-4-deoxychorismate synthase